MRRHFGGKNDEGSRLGKARAPIPSAVLSSSIAASRGSCGVFDWNRKAARKRGLKRRSTA